jgi:hypothetical protein
MDYNNILRNKIILLFNEKKFADIPMEVKNCYINDSRNFKIKNVKDIINEINCIENVLSNVIWKQNYDMTITYDDIYLLNGYIQKKFKDELFSPEYLYLNKESLAFYKKFDIKSIFSNSKIILRIKGENGIHIRDGYHKIFSALSKIESITFKCTVGFNK